MDNFCHIEESQDHLAVVAAISAGTAVASGAKKLWYKIKKPVPKGDPDKAARAEAQKISDAGGYLTLTPFQKSLINMPDYIQAQVNAEAVKSGSGMAADLHRVAQEIAEKVKNAKSITASQGKDGMTVMTYLPFIIIGVVIIYFVIRKK